MARAGWVRLTDAVFEKDGKQIPFRKASITPDGERMRPEDVLELTIRESASKVGKKGRAKKGKAAAPKKAKAAPKKTARQAAAEAKPGQVKAVEQALRAWRLALAKRQGVPAFRIMTDKVLLEIAETRPMTAAELLAISGMGIKSVEKYGAQIYRIVETGGRG
jgi:superfamily II DNA helicase RecQ